jgi:hypothetical protein
MFFIFFSYKEYDFIYNKNAILKASEQTVQKQAYDWDSLIGLIDLFIFIKCDLVIATHSSNFGRLVYEFMHVDDPNPFNKFKSLDSEYFIYGYNNGILSNKYNLTKFSETFNLSKN